MDLSALLFDVIVGLAVLFDAGLDGVDEVVFDLVSVGLQPGLLAILICSERISGGVKVGFVLAFKVALGFDLLELAFGDGERSSFALACNFAFDF